MALTRRFALGALGTLPLTRIARGQAAHRLTVLHINDFHSRHEPVDVRALGCGPEQDGCSGGSARLATRIALERAAAEADGRAVLVLDAGDQFQGSLFYTAHHGMAELAVQHAVGVDAMAVGNHEFDNGPETLGRYAAAARFPVLSANVDASAEPTLVDQLRPYALFDRGGLRVGVVGLTTTETLTSSSPGPRVRITDPAAALAQAAQAARTEGARLLIALSHLGVLRDLALEGAAVIVGGHSHTLLSNQEPGALGPHPSRSRSGALVVQAGAYGRYVGRLDLDVAADGTVLAYGGECRRVDLDVPEDPAVAALVASYAAPLQALRDAPVGVLPDALDNASCRFTACAFGRMVAGAMLAAAKGADAAIMNAGGLRTGLRPGPTTLGDILGALPFGNTLATLGLSGADLRAALEHGLSLSGRGGFPQTAGLRLEWNLGLPAGERITRIEVGTEGNWAPLEPGRTYSVATNSFLRAGGDGYIVLRDRAIDPYDAGPGIAELVAQRITGVDATPPR